MIPGIAFYLILLALSNDKLATIHNPATIFVDKKFANYISNQAISDTAIWVTMVADSIIATEEVTFANLNIIFICNHFNSIGRITCTPPDDNKNLKKAKSDAGKQVLIIAKNLDSVLISLPGNPGMNGDSGKVGRSGVPAVSQKGGNGGNGQHGGDGGILEIISMSKGYKVDAALTGGIGGKPGIGGKGGKTYIEKEKSLKPGEHGIPEKYLVTKDEPNGSNGLPGEEGVTHNPKLRKVTKDTFNEKVAQYTTLTLNDIREKGWQVYFSKKSPK